MRIGAFEVNEPLPKLHQPHAISMLRPWVDVGSVGTLVLSQLETRFGAEDLARLVKPGSFFDFTRYRPTIYSKEGRREVAIPNTFVTCAKQETGNDFLFFHLLEPHMLGEVYVDSVLLLLKRFGVKRYCLLGSMYDSVSHTRPLIVTGGGIGRGFEEELERAGVESSNYQGPTSILYLISQRAAKIGIETFTLLVHLPQYTQLDDDYMGLVRLMEVLSSLYDVSIADADIAKAERQHKHLNELLDKTSQLKEIVTQLEARYDARMARKEEELEMPQLSPEVERFLREMDKRFREG